MDAALNPPLRTQGGAFVRQFFSASEKHDALLKSSCTHACQSKMYSSFDCRQLERKRKRGSALNLTTFNAVIYRYERWGEVCWRTFPPSAHHLIEVFLSMQREIANFLASGKNYFYTISYLLMNQAHISKGVRVESFMASLQGVLEVCRTNVPPCVRKPLK